MPRAPRTAAEFRMCCAIHPHCPRIRRAFARWLEQRGRVRQAALLLLDAEVLIERRNAMVLANQGLIGFVLKKLWGIPAIKKHGWNQCYSDGQIGLIRAAELWRVDGGAKFGPYACRAILRAILEEVNKDWLIQLPQEPSPKWDHYRQTARKPMGWIGLPLHLSTGGSACGETSDISSDAAGAYNRDCFQVAAPADPQPYYDEPRPLDAALDALPAKQRRVVELLYYSGFSGAEAAEELGISPACLKIRRDEALHTLRTRLAA